MECTRWSAAVDEAVDDEVAEIGAAMVQAVEGEVVVEEPGTIQTANE